VTTLKARVAELTTIVVTPPANEAQARELAPLRSEPELLQKVAAEAAELTPVCVTPLAVGVLRPAEQHPAAVYMARLAPGSRRSQRWALEVIAAFLSRGRATAQELDWSAVRYQHVAAVRAVLAERYAPATANAVLAGLRGVLREAWRLGQLGSEELQRALDVPGIRGERLPAGRALSAGELRALFAVCADRGPGGARDAALLAVLYGCGLRRAEIVALSLGDYDPETGELAIRSGKGAKGRIVYASAGAWAALEAWVAARGEAPGALFVAVNKGGAVDPELRGLSGQAVADALQRLGRRAGVAEFSPHDLRRTFAGDLLDAGADVSTVQRLMGHASVSTTAAYDRRPEQVKRRAAELLHVPYAG